MPKLPPDRIPGYLHHASGQARVRLNGKDVLLGRYDSPESREKYNRVTPEWLANGRQLPAPGATLTVPSGSETTAKPTTRAMTARPSGTTTIRRSGSSCRFEAGLSRVSLAGIITIRHN
jgi:hypothetical protein